MNIEEMQLKFNQFAMRCDPEELLQEARAKGVDLHSYVASKVLKKDMEAVTPQERACSKTVLFTWVFCRPTGLKGPEVK